MSSANEHTLTAGNLRLTFAWRQDRYAHTLEVLSDGIWRPAFTSVEGTPEDVWPASPPWQSLHVESRPGGLTVALLVGMAGKSHWSASIEFNPQAGGIRFDLACRVREAAPAQLGCTYRMLEHAAGCQLLPDRAAPALMETQADQMVVRAQSVVDAGPATIRWAYRVTPV